MKILKIIDGFVTNSSSESTYIILALKKGKKLSNMLEKIGLSPEFTTRFEDDYALELTVEEWVKSDYLDSNIYDIQNEYEILQSRIITDAFGDEIGFEDRSDFRRKFYDEIKIKMNDLPIQLVDNDFIFLHNIYSDFRFEHERKEDIKNKIWFFIEQLKNPYIEITPRQPKSYEYRKFLEPSQKNALEEIEKLIEVRIPVVDEIKLMTIEEYLNADEQIWLDLIPEIKGFKIENRDIVALGFTFRMKNLEKKDFPDSITDFNHLKILDLGYCDWLNSFDTFSNIKSVEILKLPSYHTFRTPPESIRNLTSLKRLYIGSCMGKVLPESIGDLKKLEFLILDFNNHRTINRDVPTIIPETIGSLESLKILDLRSNNINTIPSSIGNIDSLQGLNLAGNNLSELPLTIGNLKELKDLNLHSNRLVSLPETLLDLKNLQSIWIDYYQMNNLQKNPKALKIINELKKNDVSIEILFAP